MIRANDKGLAPAPILDEPAPKRGLVNGRNIIVLVGVIAWLAVLLLFVAPQLTKKPAQNAAPTTPATSAPATAASPAAAGPATTTGAAARPATAAAENAAVPAAPAPKAVPVPQLAINNRVFNLSGATTGYKYVKLSLIVDFTDDKGDFAKAKGDALKKAEDTFAADHTGALNAFNDILTSTVSNKTAADLASPSGKEALRQDLIARFNQALAGSGERVSYVIFSDFVMQ